MELGPVGDAPALGLVHVLAGDQVAVLLEPHNLLRQNFYADDVGRFKSQALADRLARAYRRPVGYSVYPFREEDSRPDGHRYPGLPSYGNSLLIGCADNAAARRAMAECLPGDPRRWLIDAGNDTHWGQVLVGKVADRDFGDEPRLRRRDLLPAARAHGAAARSADCRVDHAAGRGLRGRPRPHRSEPHHQPDDGVAGITGGPPHGGGRLPLHGLYLDMEQGTVTPTYATPEAVERVMRSDSEPGIRRTDAPEGG